MKGKNMQQEKKIVTGTIVEAARVLEVFKFKKSHHKIGSKLILAGKDMELGKDIDVTWLQAAADTYKISPDINDYVIVQVPLVTSDIPNRNLQAFAYEELTYFDPLHGRMVYQTFIGKPTYQDHNNSDPLQAKGINLDASLVPVPRYGVWKTMVLSGFDRTKDKTLVDQIIRKRRNSYSMGALTDAFLCSVCGAVVDPMNLCEHMQAGKGSLHNGKLAYEICIGVNFIENSSVEQPADVTAISNEIYS